MTETPQTTGMQRFRDKLQEIYWLILWIFWILFGLTIPSFDLAPAWAGWIIFILGVIGTISKSITLFRNSPIFILIEALDNFCLATLLAIGFVLSLLNGGELTWVLGGLAVVSAFLGIGGLKKYKKGKAMQ